MVERVITDGLVLIRPRKNGDILAAVSAIGQYEDLSAVALTYDINESQANASVRPHGTNRRARVLPGDTFGHHYPDLPA